MSVMLIYILEGRDFTCLQVATLKLDVYFNLGRNEPWAEMGTLRDDLF